MAEIVQSPIDVNEYVRQAFNPSSGAVVVFLGVVRNRNEGKEVSRLEYEAYKPIAVKAMQQIEDELRNKYGLKHITIVHRIGNLKIGEISLLVVVSAPHRKEAISAIEECVNLIKKRVPVWKKEFFTDGTYTWTKGEILEVKND